MRSLKGKTAVITGVASGIGRELALQLAQKGCNLALADIDTSGLEATRKEVSQNSIKVSAHPLDVSKKEAVYQFAEEVIDQHHDVHLVINNAGVAVAQTIEDVSYEDFEWLMGINFWGVVYGTKAFLPHLKEQEEAHIVNISSIFGIVAVPTMAVYNASKFAVKGFTESLKQELKGTSVKVSCIHPGGIKTRIAHNARAYKSIDGKSRDSKSFATSFDNATMTSAEDTAKKIIKGITREKERILIGPDAQAMDLIQRLFPETYGNIINRLASMRGL
ncbi:SDR family NAD(P)-dependent oxidoreductase [Deltaproteobacteria bacterium TL4]